MSIYLRDANTNRAVKIKVAVRDKRGVLSPDCSYDFFAAAGLPFDNYKGAYIVDDVDRYIRRALHWEKDSEDHEVFIQEQSEAKVTFEDGIWLESEECWIFQKTFTFKFWDDKIAGDYGDLVQVIIDYLEEETGKEIDTDGTDFWDEEGNRVATGLEVEEVIDKD